MRLLSVLVLLLLLPARVAADSVVIAAISQGLRFGFPPLGPVTIVELPLTASGLGPIRRQITVPGVLASGPVVSSDGRYVVWTALPSGAGGGAANLFALDRRSGEVLQLPGFTASGTLLSDPRVLRFFVVSAGPTGSITTVVLGGTRTVPVSNLAMVGPLSSDGRELFVTRSTTEAGTYVAAINPLSGTELRRLLELPPSVVALSMTLSRDGRRLYVGIKDFRAGEPDTSLRVLDAASGAELARRAASFAASSGAVALDEGRNRVYAFELFHNGHATTGRVLILDGSTLNELGRRDGIPRMVFDHVHGVGINISAAVADGGGCSGVAVETWAAALQPIATFTPDVGNSCPVVAVATPPDVPSGVSREVTGRRVVLTWAHSVGAIDYEVEAGSATGLSNLARVRTSGVTQFVAENVPPGTYYLRVRAINEVDASAPSSETVVTVP